LYAVDYVPDTGEILYTADQGGNEIRHLYRLKHDGQSEDLTPGENETVDFYGCAKDKKSFYYTSNVRDPKFFDLYQMRVNDWTSSMVYENEKGLHIAQIARDGSRISLRQPISESENRLFLYNVASGEMTEISETDRPGIHYSLDFSDDGSSFFYITDAGREFKYLARYDIGSGSREVLYETNWDVLSSNTSENERYRVIHVNEDAKDVLHVIDNKTGKDISMPDIPDGNVWKVGFSRSEKKMSLWADTSRLPTNLYVYDFETRELKRLTNTLNPEIDPEHLVAAEVIRYNSFDGLEIPAIYYRPKIASPTNKVSALVWVHGGPGLQSGFAFSELKQFLVNHGYAVLAVNNRGSSGYGKSFHKMDDRNHGEKDLMDCIYGKKYLQTLDNIDPDKIGIIGGSYGGFMAMAAMTLHPDEFQAAVNLFGVTNWIRTLKSTPTHGESYKTAIYAEMGDPFSEEDAERLHRISPVFHGDKVKHPVMVLHGAKDIRVLLEESDEMVAAIRANNVPVVYVVFPDEGHGFRKKENQIKGYGQILVFLDKYLKGKQ
jgi:dipeptidyl aminopeptidase/acylaminoacyl peptidase